MDELGYRPGGVGAMMDEYERVARDLTRVVGALTEEEFEVLRDPDTDNEDCRSIQTIMVHVVRATYGYAEYIRVALGIPGERPAPPPPTRDGTIDGLAAGLVYTAGVLEGRWTMSDDEIVTVTFQTRWGQTYDLEQMLEHAIVHILRHRRQIERFLGRPNPLRSEGGR